MRKYKVLLPVLVTFFFAINVEAQRIFAKRDKLIEKVSSGTDREKIRTMAALGMTYAFLRPDSGIHYATKAISLARKNADIEGEALALQSMGWALWASGNLDSAAYYALDARRLHQDLSLPNQQVNDLNCLANIYCDGKNFEAALAYGRSALSILQTHAIPAGLVDETNSEAAIRNIITWIYLKWGKADLAMLEMDSVIQADPKGNFTGGGFPLFTLGDIASLKNDTGLALSYYRKASLAAEKSGTYSDIIYCNYGIARIHLTHQNPDSAIYYAMQSIHRFGTYFFKDGLLTSYGILSEAYKQKGQTDSALKYVELIAAERENLYGVNKSRQLMGLAQREIEEKRKIEEARKSLLTKVRIYALLFGLFVLAIIGMILYRNNRSRKKSNELLVAKNRELEIESALERVRSRSLAMHKSDELRQVVQIVFEKVQELGFSIEGAVGILEFREGSKDHVQWIVDPEHNYPRPFEAPYVDHPISTDIINAHETGVEYFASLYDKEVKDSLFKFLFETGEYKNLPGEVKNLILDSQHYGISCAFARNSAILIPTLTGRLLSKNEENILKRFARVFDQAYTRFLDLQKSEAQARNAQIETGLEKIRSRSLAMRSSEELKDVVVIVFEKLREFGLSFDGAGIQLYTDGSKDSVMWVHSPDLSTVGNIVNLPFEEEIYLANPIPADIWKARESDFKVIRKTYSFEEKNAYFNNFVFKHNDFNKIPQEVRNLILQAPGDTIATIMETYSSVGINRWAGPAFTDQDVEVLKRVAKVFDQVYIRFQDLQKAEAQARESQIQLALERVRARTMAMQYSHELNEVVHELYLQIRSLDFQYDFQLGACTIVIMDRNSSNMEHWLAGFTQEKYPECYPVRNVKHRLHDAQISAWKNGERFASFDIGGEELTAYSDLVFLETGYKNLPKEEKERLRTQESVVFNLAYMTYGALMWAPNRLTEEQADILQRFAKVFDQSYTRFLDIQKAEAQTRESQIQLALERVRARTMAMQHSNELMEAANILFQQVNALGIPVWTCGYNIWEPEEDTCTGWMSTRFEIQPSFRIPLTESPTFIHMRESRLKGELFFTEVVSGEELKDHYKYMLSLPDFRKIVIDHLDDDFLFPESQVNNVYNFKNGNLIFISSERLPEYHEIFIRFTTVFEQTYTRFLDLQKSEARAQAAMLDASMERIRAETASMRHAADLERITPMIWEELTMLGVPFIRCGVFIIDEEHEFVHTFLSTPDGKAIGSFHLPYTANSETTEIVDHWRKKAMYIQHWDKMKFQSWTDTLIQQGYLERDNNLNSQEAPENLYLHMVPFSQGMFYVGHTEPVCERDLNLAKNLADAFSSAYARYEDFVRLELAKQQVDTALIELKQAQSQLIQSEKMASLGELTAGIAHEIQNPLNFVNNFSEINIELADEIKQAVEHGDLHQVKELSDSIRSNQEKINEHGRRADAIVKSMLHHSRSSSGISEPTDLNKLADEYLRLAYHGLRAKDKSFNAALETDFDPALGMVPVIPQEMGRVLLNLFNNAFYAVNEKEKLDSSNYQPTVTVKTMKKNGQVEIQVIDNGSGIPEKLKGKIFQPFFTTKPTGQGTGLGLSLGYDIIKAHRGELKVISKDGEGTTFTIQIPA